MGTTITPTDQENVKALTQKIFYGDVTNIHAGVASSLTLNIVKGDISSLKEVLEAQGIPAAEANELATIVEKEMPQNETEPLGAGAQSWLKEKLKTGSIEAWKIGKSVVSEVIAEALKQFYGLK